MKINNKVVIISGGAQGIGKATAVHFLQQNARVVIIDSDKIAGHETQKELSPLGEILFILADISKEKPVSNAITKTIKHFKQIDILVNNAGIKHDKPIEKLSLEEWNKTIGSNLTGAFLLTKFAAKHLRKTKGSIINIASTRALMSEANTEAYSVTKGALVAFTHALAISLGPDIRVNCISPGWIDVCQWEKTGKRKKQSHTKAEHAQHPVGRIGEPKDIANMIGYLTSDDAGFITGANFVIDGGMTRKMIYK